MPLVYGTDSPGPSWVLSYGPSGVGSPDPLVSGG